MIHRGDVVLFMGKKYKVVGVCNKAGKDVCKLRSKDGKCLIYSIDVNEVERVVDEVDDV